MTQFWELRPLACGLLLTAAIALPARAEGTYEIPAGAHFNKDKLAKVGEFFRNEVATGKISGSIVLIQQHGKPVYHESFGVQDVVSRAPMTDKTIFRLFSMTKAITAVVSMQLLEEGKIKLDDPVSKYIPSFANVKVGWERKAEDGAPALELIAPDRPMTVRDLMTHTSGITYGFYGDSLVRKAYRAAEIYKGDFDLAEFADRIAKLPLENQPGALWNYGHSTDVLARVMEVAAGKSLYAIEKEKLLDPLGMTDTSFYVTDPEKVKLMAQPVPNDSDFRVGRVNDPAKVKKWESASGGMVSTMADYSRFVQMLLNGGTLDGRTYRHLQADGDRPDRTRRGRRTRLFVFSGRRLRLWPWTCSAHRPGQRQAAAARRSRGIEMGRRQWLLLHRGPQAGHVLRAAGADTDRATAYPADAEATDL